MLRLGLCCTFVEEPIRFRRTTVTYLQKLDDPLAYVEAIITHNCQALDQAVQYCADNGIGSFRINSQFLPAASHPEVGYTLDALPSSLCTALKKVGERAKELKVRLTFHPDQFVVLNSPNEETVERSLAELESQGALAALIGADVLNIHGGGGYGDKERALARFAQNFPGLSQDVRNRLTVENDDKTYTPKELLPLCEKLGIPLVYDVHHHRCLPDGWSVEEASKQAYATWNREPLFHISSPLNGWKGKDCLRHHDYIDLADFPSCWRELDPLTVEVEAKAKERAVKRLLEGLESQE